ncbi:MAG: cellulase family glycosylhydrolase [Polyangiaceae bacterium]
MNQLALRAFLGSMLAIACGAEPASSDSMGSGGVTTNSAGGSAGQSSNGSGGSSQGGVATTSNGGSNTTAGGSTGNGGSSPSSGGSSTSSGGASSAGAAGTGSSGGSSAGGQVSSGGTAGAAGGSTSTTNQPGVVVAVDSNGTLGCVPLCMGTTPSDPAKNPDWGYENNASCIIKSTLTANTNQACTTGQPLPTPNRNGLSGVVVATDSAGTLACVPLCVGTTPSGTDPDWGWEYQASCVIRGTDTANCNQPCKTGAALPSKDALPSRSGVMIDNVCVALCACGASGANPDWGWEYQAQCVVPSTPTATGKLECTAGQTPVLTPPALTGTKKADGFYTSNGKLYDAYGAEFVMRGINNPHIWFDTGNQYLAYRALDTIANYGTNTIRVVWQTTGGTPTLLAQILHRIVELKMVPIVELHDVTGKTSNAELLNMAKYYTQADVKKVLTDYRAYLLVNIANEWSGTDYLNAYKAAIAELRNNGINHTLVIDANNWGQNADSIFSNATALLSADTQHNLLFSVHMYGMYGTTAAVDAVLDRAIATPAVPLIVGEFGHQLSGQSVAWQRIVSKCQSNKLGYLAWSWKGNASADAALDLASGWQGPLTTWGQNVIVNDANSIQRTSSKASIFQ